MLRGTACGLLLLPLLLLLLLGGGLGVALATNAFPRLALLALGAITLLVTLHATNKTLVAIVATVPLCFHHSGLGTLACVVFVSCAALQLGHRSTHRSSVTMLCRWPACSIVGLNHSLTPSLLVYDVEQCVGVVRYKIASFPFPPCGETRVALFLLLSPLPAACHALACTFDHRASPRP